MQKKITNLKSCILNLKPSITFFVKKSNAGFTLIETFIAITVLLIAITGPLFLVTKGLTASKLAKSQITAMYLTQEAIEYVRNVRDGNILNGNNWLLGLEDCVLGVCKIDSPEQKISSCDPDSCENLKYNSSNYIYGYTSGEVSRFKREIKINEVTPNKEMEIVVDMFWVDGPHDRQFTAKERLFNWQ